MKQLNPGAIRAPFGRYAHGIEAPPGMRLLFVSGQVGARPDGVVPAEMGAQAEACLDNIAAVLAEGGMTPAHLVRMTSYLTTRDDFAAYMAVRDAWLAKWDAWPTSTLLIVSGFARPEFLLEVEVTAAA